MHLTGRVLAVAISLGVLVATASPASARHTGARLICNRFTEDGDNIAYLTVRPKRCSVWRANWAHYQSVTFVKGRWAHWGSRVARANVVVTYNMGFRQSATFEAYRLKRDCTGRYLVYTRVRVDGGRGGTYKPDTCPTDVSRESRGATAR